MSKRRVTFRGVIAASAALCLAIGLAGCTQVPNGAAEANITLPLDAASPADVAASEDFSWLDFSETAKKNFLSWYAYERQVPSDVRTDAELFGFGFQACKNIAKGTNSLGALEKAMSKTYGLTISGAAAVIRSALETICHPLDQGYKTYFDERVAQFQDGALADPKLTWQSPTPPEWDFGNFMRGACARYNAAGIGNIDVFMFEHRSEYPLIAGVPNTDPIRVLLSHSMFPGCWQIYTPYY